MNESRFTAKLLKDLRTHPRLGGCVIFKLNDRMTKGIPDFCVINKKHTEWFEVKIAPNKTSEIQKYFVENIKPAAAVVTVTMNRGAANPFIYMLDCIPYSLQYGHSYQELVDDIVARCVND
jgi:hypothetical protein